MNSNASKSPSAASALRALVPVLVALADELDAATAQPPFSPLEVGIPLKQTGISPRILRRAIRDKRLPAWKVGTHFRVLPSDVQAWLATRRVVPRVVETETVDSVAERAIARAVSEGRIRLRGRKS